MSGPFIVEEIEKAGYSHLRLVFMNSQFFVQSQARLKLGKETCTFSNMIRNS